MQSPVTQQMPPQAQNMFSMLNSIEKQLAANMIQAGDTKGLYAMLAEKQKMAAAGAPDYTDIGGMRKELKAMSDEYQSIKGNFGGLQKALTRPKPNAIDDIAVIFDYMKSLDPTSVVREGEQVMLKRTDGVFGILGNYMEGLKNGKTFNAEQRRNILNSAYEHMAAKVIPMQETAAWYGDIAQKQGIKPNYVVNPMFSSIPKFLEDMNPANLPPVASAPTAAAIQTQVIDGKTYMKTPDGWVEQ